MEHEILSQRVHDYKLQSAVIPGLTERLALRGGQAMTRRSTLNRYFRSAQTLPRVIMRQLVLKFWRISVAFAMLAITACAAVDPRPQPEPGPEPPSGAMTPEVVPEKSLEVRPGGASGWVLAGEMALRRGYYSQALDAFARAAELTRQPDVAQRATEVALTLGDDARALAAASRWVALTPQRMDARQVLIVLQLRAGNVDAASRELRTLLEDSGESAGETLRALHDALVQEVESPDGVLALLESLSADYGDLAEFHYLRAAAAHAGDKLALAETAIAEARERAPQWVDPLILEARILAARNQPEAAVAVMESGLQMHPGNDQLRLAYGRLLFELEREEQARRELERLVEANPSHAGAIRVLGMLALEQDRFDDAHNYFMRLLQLGSHTNEAYYHLGTIEMGQRNHTSAMRWLSQVSDGPYLLPARIRLAEALAHTGNPEAARDLLRQMRVARPDARLALYETEGQLLYEQGRYQAAREIYDQGLEEFPGDRTLLYGRALSLERLDKLEAAERDLRRILEQAPDDPLALNALGYTLADRTSRLDEALEYIARAMAQEPDNPAIIDSMGWVKYRLGDYEAAEQHLRRAYDMAEDPEIAAHLAELLWVTGRHDEAREIWRQALEYFPDNEVLRDTVQRLKD